MRSAVCRFFTFFEHRTQYFARLEIARKGCPQTAQDFKWSSPIISAWSALPSRSFRSTSRKNRQTRDCVIIWGHCTISPRSSNRHPPVDRSLLLHKFRIRAHALRCCLSFIRITSFLIHLSILDNLSRVYAQRRRQPSQCWQLHRTAVIASADGVD